MKFFTHENLEKTSNFILVGIFIIWVGCNNINKKSNSSDDDRDNELDTEYRISTYEFHISVGALDGQTFSVVFPNDGEHGQGQLLSKVSSNISKDVISIKINDEKEEGSYYCGCQFSFRR